MARYSACARSEIDRKFDEIVAFAEVEKFLDTPVKRYSSGMYVRLAFAVAAHLDPEILVVDEVLAVGDASFQKKSLARMGKAASGGRSILFVSHNLAAINSLCTRCLLMDHGAVVLSGSPGEVTSQYQARVHETAQNGSSLDEVERYGSGKARFTARDNSGLRNSAIMLRLAATWRSNSRSPVVKTSRTQMSQR